MLWALSFFSFWEPLFAFFLLSQLVKILGFGAKVAFSFRLLLPEL
jgi:hypothetical protein